jgi:hypothetical protein
MAPDAQFEIRQFAWALGHVIEDAFPRTWELFFKGMAPILDPKSVEPAPVPTEEERQMTLLALAELSLARPGWDFALNALACKTDNVSADGRAITYDEFRATSRRSP